MFTFLGLLAFSFMFCFHIWVADCFIHLHHAHFPSPQVLVHIFKTVLTPVIPQAAELQRAIKALVT